jgi:hypothetical protein
MPLSWKHGKHDREACFPVLPSKIGEAREARREAREACFPALTLQKGSTGKHGSIDRASHASLERDFEDFSLPYGKGKHDNPLEEALA